MKKENIFELGVWLIILSIIFGISYAKYRAYNIKHTKILYFKDVDGIVKGSPIRFLGVVIGHVKEIKYKNGFINVKIIITKEGIEIPKGSTAAVQFTGLAGSKSIEIEPPLKKSDLDVIITENPMRIKDIFDESETYVEALMYIENQIKIIPMQNIYGILEKTTTKYDWSNFDRMVENTTLKIQKDKNSIQKTINSTNKINEQVERINTLISR